MGPPSRGPGQGRNRGQEGAPSLPLVSPGQVCRALNYQPAGVQAGCVGRGAGPS